MKYLKLLTLLAGAYLIVGCNNDDDKGNNNGMNGKWNLVEITPSFAGSKENFSKGSITWSFDENSHKVNVKDSRTIIPANVGHDLPKTGIYDYTTESWSTVCDKALDFDTRNFGCITINGNTLLLSTAAVDGPTYRLIR
ncbi:hypothetical protein D3C87_157780 [compost metagenome]